MIKNINTFIAITYIGLSVGLSGSAYAQDITLANTQVNISKPAVKPTKAISNANSANTSSRKGNEIILPSNSPQLVNLKTELIKEMLAPSTNPLNGKIIFDENFTTRIGTPVDGRVTKINVQIGDYVKAGQVLMLMDAPDLGNALADARKAQADLQLKKQAMRNSCIKERTGCKKGENRTGPRGPAPVAKGREPGCKTPGRRGWPRGRAALAGAGVYFGIIWF